MGKVLCGLLLTLLMRTIDNQLIRSPDVYKGVIQEICDHYQCFSITLFYSGLLRTQDIDVMTRLKNLSMYFERELLIRTTVTDISSYATQFSSARFRLMVKPLFVLLNDFDDMKVQFAEMLVPLMDISKPMWMIFMQDKTSIEDFFEDVFIPFDCKFMVSKKSPNIKDREIITEIYRVYYGRRLRQDSFATWNIFTGMDPPSLTFNQRRSDLDGINLRFSLQNYPPAIIFEKDKNNQVIAMKGSCIKIIEELEKTLNFRAIYQLVPLVGRSLPNGTWSGCIGSLLENSSDISIMSSVALLGQTQLLDYTTQFFRIDYRFFIRKSSRDVLYWDKFSRPFQPIIWLLVGFIVLLGSVVLFIIKIIGRKKFNGIVKASEEPWSLLNTLLSVFGAFCSQGMPSSRLVSLQLVQFTIHITAIIIGAAYSARLISFLTTHTSVNYITTTEELLDDASFKLITIKNAVNHLSFKNSTSKLLRRVFKRMMENEKYFPANRLEGLNRVCSDRKLACMASHLSVAHLDIVNCTIAAMDILGSVPISFMFQHNSPFRKIISYQLNLIRESSVLGKILNNRTIINDEVEEVWSAVEFIDIISLIALLVGGFIISIFLLFGEKIVYKKLTQKPKAKQRVVVKVKPLIHKKHYVGKKNISRKVKQKRIAKTRVINSKNLLRERKLNAFDDFQYHTRISINMNAKK